MFTLGLFSTIYRFQIPEFLNTISHYTALQFNESSQEVASIIFRRFKVPNLSLAVPVLQIQVRWPSVEHTARDNTGPSVEHTASDKHCDRSQGMGLPDKLAQ